MPNVTDERLRLNESGTSSNINRHMASVSTPAITGADIYFCISVWIVTCVQLYLGKCNLTVIWPSHALLWIWMEGRKFFSSCIQKVKGTSIVFFIRWFKIKCTCRGRERSVTSVTWMFATGKSSVAPFFSNLLSAYCVSQEKRRNRMKYQRRKRRIRRIRRRDSIHNKGNNRWT